MLSLFISGFRAFLVALFAVLGTALGFLLLLLPLSGQGPQLPSVPEIQISTVRFAEDPAERGTWTSETPVLLHLNLSGTIGIGENSPEYFRRLLASCQTGTLKRQQIKGLLLTINTPGGTVSGADGIYHCLKEFKENLDIPIYAFVDGMSTSGGVYVMSAADRVYASDVSLIGSVGVVMPYANFHKSLENLGIRYRAFSEGKGKTALDPFAEFREEESDQTRQILASFYETFVNIVSQARPQVYKEFLENDLGAQVVSARQAEEIGLIDSVRNYPSEAVKDLAKAAGIDGQKYLVLSIKLPKGLFSSIQSAISSTASPRDFFAFLQAFRTDQPSPLFLSPYWDPLAKGGLSL